MAGRAASAGRRTLYEILGVPPNSSKQEIKSQFYRLSMLYHPDRATVPAPAQPPRDADSASWRQEKFVQINDAYQILSDDAKRREYDRENGFIGGVERRGAPQRPAWRAAAGGRAVGVEAEAEAEVEETDFRGRHWSRWSETSPAGKRMRETAQKSSRAEQEAESRSARNRMVAIVLAVIAYYVSLRT